MTLRNMIWRFQTCKYFCKIFKFPDFMDDNISHSVRKSRNNEVITYSKSPHHVLQSYVHI